ncbi:MAG TPA: TolC family protein [Terriglobia bacterium]|nr:TolC family protein [Terriglobia bacterium]
MNPRSLRWLILAVILAFGSRQVKAQTGSSSATSPPAQASGQSSMAQPSSTESNQPAAGTNVDFRSRNAFPNPFAPYSEPVVPATSLSNSSLLQSLTQNGKVELSLTDALDLAIQNNLDIAVARYNLPLAQADYLRTRGGGAARGVSGEQLSSAIFAGAIGGGTGAGSSGSTGGAGGFSGGGGATNTGSNGCCDPFFGVNFGWDHRYTPLGNLIVSGVPEVITQNTSYTAFFGQGFFTGTSYTIAGSGFRQSTTAQNSLFNPEVPLGVTIGVNQHLLQGFGYRANAANLREAKNGLRIADSTFRLQVMTTAAQVLNLYYTLLSDKEQVRVQQEAVNYSAKLLSDNKKQVEIGTLAPIEVVRAESEQATDQQNLVVAETTYREDQEKLKTAISKHVEPALAEAEIDVTDKLPEPQPGDVPPLEEALKLAGENRPEIVQADLNLRNFEIAVQSVRNRLLPTLDAFATYAPTGLSGNQVLCNGPIDPTTGRPTTIPCLIPGGVSQSFTQVLHSKFPDYSFGLNLTIPIRNRTAQADAATALLQQRQQQAAVQRQINQVQQDVRNAEIAVTQAKAQIDAAAKATELARQTLDAEQKKFKLGESTTLNVILTERDLNTAEGNEVKARSAYAQALVQYETATGTLLDRNNIQFANAKSGQVHRVPNIPGTPVNSSQP